MVRRRRSHKLRFESLEDRRLLAIDGPVINEFCASNSGVLLDEDGETSDWIELYNPTDSAVSLDGWYLADRDPDDPTAPPAWQLPAVTLPADGYLVVFASGKNRSDPASELHADFRLSAGGEYLGLIEPDGVTVADAYAPTFPPQESNISYGIAHVIDTDVLVERASDGRLLVPMDASVDDTWTATDFDDSSWTAVTTGLGYDVEVGDLYNEIRRDDPVAYWRLSEVGSVSVPMTNSAIASDGFDSGVGTALDSLSLLFDGIESGRGVAGLPTGVADTAARFDGVDDYIQIPDSSALGNVSTATSQRSVELWFSADAVPPVGSTAHQVLWEDGGSVNGFNVYLYQGEIYFGGWNNNAGHWVHAPVDPATAYHAVMTYDATADLLRGYLNGQLVAELSTANVRTVGVHSGDNGIGCVRQDTRYENGKWTGNGELFDGVIDEVAIYRHILSPESIGRHYEAGLVGVPSPRLVAYWPMDETLDGGAFSPDTTGNYSASIVGASLGADGSGRSGRAMVFDGDDDYLSIDAFAELDTPRALTLSLWFQRTTDRASDATNHDVHNVLVAHSSSTLNDNFEVGTLGDAVEGYFHTDEKEGPAPSIRQPAGIADGQWHHLAVTYDKDRPNELAVHVDGNMVAEYPDWGGRFASSTAQLTIGSARPAGDRWGDFEGLIDEVAYWDGALDSDQIALLAGGGQPTDLTTFHGLIDTDLEASMHDQASSAYARMPFVVERDPMTYDGFALEMNVDDGFVAYLNGQEVARLNATDPLAFDSTADAPHPDGQAVQTLSWDLSAYQHLLVEGDNVLAIRLLNVAPDDSDLLAVPRLSGWRDLGVLDRYFIEPTPGAENNESFAGFVADTSFTVDRGFFNTPFEVEIATSTEGATIRYTTDARAPTATTGTLYTGPITIDTTTVLRAAAFKPAWQSSNVDTQSYIFRADVLLQPDAPVGLPSNWGPATADYGMDPEVIADPRFADDVLPALGALPTMSLVIAPEDFWDADTGIYANTLKRGLDWERVISVELLDFEHDGAMQVDAGIRLQGNASRSTSRPKHNMRLIFRKEYGPSMLDFTMFDEFGVDRYNQIVLRGGNGDSWIHPNSSQRTQTQYVRDQWFRDAQTAMGHPTCQQTYAHLYFNGLYWGLYHLIERPDSAFMAEHFGGNDEDYDVLRHRNETLDGDRAAWNAMMALVRSGSVADDAVYQQILQYVDPVNLIDYMLINFYGGNTDWDHNNWYAGRKREAGATWKFFCWDSEVTFRSPTTNVTGVFKTNQPSEVHQTLLGNPDYLMLFNDRIERHLRGDGVLTPDSVRALWAARRDEIELSLVAETARWGDYYRPDNPYNPIEEWMAEWVRLSGIFDERSDTVLDQLEARGVITDVATPRMLVDGTAQQGGIVAAGASLTFDWDDPLGAGGTVYYSLDGTDPRLPGGAISPTAISDDGSGSILSETMLVKARVLGGTTWSALSEAQFLVARPAVAGDLAVSELNYHPYEPEADELAVDPLLTAGAFEFIELQNVASEPIDLVGVEGIDGVTFTLIGGERSTLAPGEHVIVVADPTAMAMRYGEDLPIVGTFSGSLGDGGERIVVTALDGSILLDFEYNDSGSWPRRADGGGSSIEVIDPAASVVVGGPLGPSEGDSWRNSTEYGGTPGGEGVGPLVDVVINEVLAHTDAPLSDSIELHNVTAASIDIGGWYLSDTSPTYRKFRIPDGTEIPVGGYVVFDEADFNASGGIAPDDFGLDGAHGDDVWLLAAETGGKLTRFVDHVDFRASANGESFGRWPDALGGLYPMLDVTLGATNSGPRVGPLVISEVMYSPPDPPDGSDPDDLEFIEIHNPTASSVLLDNWAIAGGIDRAFDPGRTMAPGDVLVVLSFDPEDPLNIDRVDRFRVAYGIDASVVLVGGYSGQLDNGGERVRLLRPDEPPTDEPGYYPLLLEDQVDYDDVAPWPVEADGLGSSLTRMTLDGWGHAPETFEALAPTPGTVDFAPASRLDVDGDGEARALKDGIIILRYLFGVRGQPMVEGLLGSSATRTDPAEMLEYLDAARPTMLDVDANGDARALTDGIIIIRYLFGVRGGPMIEGLLGSGAMRTDPAEISEHLDAHLPPPAGVQSVGSSLPSIDTTSLPETGGPVISEFCASNASVAMTDDGTGADVTAGDGLFTTVIPATASAPGEMVRWRVTTTDTLGNSSRGPAFLNPTDSPEYYGTVVVDPTITSQLPVLHWFVANASAANTRSGTRSSILYDGEFYDNVRVDLHGQSTSGFPKKSYDFDLNRGERFRYDNAEARAKDFNLLSNWADKSKVRNTLAYETHANSGGPHHVAFSVRVEQNGEFFSTADWVEDGDDRYLDRIGYDPDGALYKVYDKLSSTSGSEKKTRQWEDKSDLQSLINGLKLTGDALVAFMMDNVDEAAGLMATTLGGDETQVNVGVASGKTPPSGHTEPPVLAGDRLEGVQDELWRLGAWHVLESSGGAVPPLATTAVDWFFATERDRETDEDGAKNAHYR